MTSIAAVYCSFRYVTLFTHPLHSFYDEVYHTVPAIIMSHEQNMHHHLIYLANTLFITNKLHVWHSMLTNMQRYQKFD
jgi:hypothetical protein